MHDGVKLAEGLGFSIGPEDVKHAADDATERGETLLIVYDLRRSEGLEELLELLARLHILELRQDVSELV